MPIKPSLTYAFTLAEFGPQAIEFLFGTAALNDASTSFTPLATIGSLTGWLRCEFYSHADQKLVTTETWVALKPLEGIKADGQAWAEIRCEARVLLSGLNTGVIEAGSGGGGGGGGGGDQYTVYWGKAVSTELDATSILALDSRQASSSAGSYYYPEGPGYLYLATPAAWSDPASITYGGFTLAWEETGSYSQIHNGIHYMPLTVSGVAYRVYRTAEMTAGAATLIVS